MVNRLVEYVGLNEMDLTHSSFYSEDIYKQKDTHYHRLLNMVKIFAEIGNKPNYYHENHQLMEYFYEVIHA